MCIDCHISYSFSCNHSERTVTLYTEVYVFVLQDMLKMFPVTSDTYSEPIVVLAHILQFSEYTLSCHNKSINSESVLLLRTD
jgi:hypothetical protein